jgi:uncharacterized repeat protein (TIGR01451 family)
MRIRTLAPALAMAAIAAVAIAPTPVSGAGSAPSVAATGDRRFNADDLQQESSSKVERSARNITFAAGPGESTYMIQFVDAAVPSYTGGKSGLPATAVESGQRLDATASRTVRYQDFLISEQAAFVDRLDAAIGRSATVRSAYQFAVNGMAVNLTANEVRAIADDPSVLSIAPNQQRELHTDAGPTWINADDVWDADPDLGLPSDYQGEGIIIGTIDTGISPSNPSFADVGDDGYDHTNPLGSGNYLGVCDSANTAQYDADFPCNDKLIGAWDFVDTGEAALTSVEGVDYDGHGSHTASTSGGSRVDNVVVTTASGFVTPPFDIGGVAPHATVISYLGCCSLVGLTDSIEQVIIDEVDVVNYSIGSDAASAAWDDFDTIGFRNARAAGIFVAVSNGNNGPGDATAGSPADAPWLTSVGASTHDRYNGNRLTGLTSTNGPLADIEGKSVTGSLLTAAPIVDAADVGDPFCEDTTGNAAFVGAIVICVRGIIGRGQKSANVAGQGAVGFILINDALNGDSLLGDEYAIPGLFISFDAGEVLRNWLANGATDHVGSIQGTVFENDPTRGDIMTSFSSRGPNQALEIISPAVTAPGVDILAALTDLSDPQGGEVHGFISGTSMSSPHVAGAGALLSQARPTWSPAEMQSALMTTAVTSVLNHDGTPATPYQQGSGRIDVGRAVMAGLLFDETDANYVAANPAIGGDPKTLNIPSFANSQCLVICEWSRVGTVPASAPAGVTWTAAAVSDTGLTLTVNVPAGAVSAGGTLPISVTANVAGAADGVVLFGRITLTPSNPAVPSVTMPVSVVPSAGVLPGAVDIQTRRDAGSQVVTGLQSVALTDFTGELAGWIEGTMVGGQLAEDPTFDFPYDDLSQVAVFLVEVEPGSQSLVVEVIEAAMPDLDLFVGTGDTPGAATEVCVSASSGSMESCNIADPAPGTWWILAQNWEGTGSPDNFVLSHATVPSSSLGNGTVEGPAGPVATGVLYDVSITWDLPEAEAGDVWYSIATIGSSPATPDNIGSFPVRLARLEDDVTKVASEVNAAAGDTVDFDITVQPNVTPTDVEYTIVDTVPAGMTINAASVTGGGVVSGQTITWTVPMATAAGATGNYVMSTPGTNANCFSNATDFTAPPYNFTVNPAIDGDSIAGTFFSASGPFNYFGQDYPNLEVSEDGFLAVTGGYGGSAWVPQTIPDVTLPNGVVAPLWSDLEASVANDRGVIAVSAPQLVAIVQWQDLLPWGENPADLTNSVGTFQTWFYNIVDADYPEIYFEYLDAPDATVPGGVTIGLENLAGSLGTSLLDAGDQMGVVQDGDVFCWDYVVPEFPPSVLEYSVTVDSPAAPGIATNEAEHTTDDPFAVAAIASADVELLGASVAVNPATLDLGDVELGDAASASVTVTNDGSSNLTISGASAGAPFNVDASACTSAIIAPAGTCDIEVTFTPTIGGPASGTLAIVSSAAGSPTNVALAGTGVRAELSVESASVAFGDVLLGTSETATVVVTNDGTAALNISSATAAAPFSADATDCAAPVAPQATCDLLVTFEPSTDGAAAGSLSIVSDAVGSPHSVALSGSGYVPDAITPIVPGRYWDTRNELTFDTLFRNTGRLTGGTSLEVQITGRGDIPDGAKAVIANLTAISPSSPGFATMYPCTDSVPTASHVNYFAADVVANSSIVPLNGDGALCVFTLATSDFALDISGFLAADSPLIGIAPARYLETRSVPGFTTFDGVSQGTGRVSAGQTIEVPIAGRGSVPDSAVAALVNVTAVNPAADGFLTVFPCGTRPDTSTVNYFAAQFVPNGAVAELSDDGDVCIYSLATTDILLDVSGYVPAGAAGIATMTPERLLDTRPGESTVDGDEAGGGRVPANGFIEVQVSGRAGIPADATAAILNVGVVYPDGPGFVTLYPCGDIPVASNVNHTTGGVVRANNSITKLSAEGTVCIYTLSGTDLILDVAGWIE